MFFLYKRKNCFHTKYYSTKFTGTEEKDKLHNIDLFASSKPLCL